MSWSTSELRVRLELLNRFKPSSKYFTDPSKVVLLLWIFYLFFFSVFCVLCLCARLFICALWSPAGKGLTSWLSFVVSNYHFPIGILGQVWYLHVSIPDHCTLDRDGLTEWHIPFWPYPKMERDTPPPKDTSTSQIWNPYLKECKRYAQDTIILKTRSEIKVKVIVTQNLYVTLCYPKMQLQT